MTAKLGVPATQLGFLSDLQAELDAAAAAAGGTLRPKAEVDGLRLVASLAFVLLVLVR